MVGKTGTKVRILHAPPKTPVLQVKEALPGSNTSLIHQRMDAIGCDMPGMVFRQQTGKKAAGIMSVIPMPDTVLHKPQCLFAPHKSHWAPGNKRKKLDRGWFRGRLWAFSSVGEHPPCKRDVAGSNPARSTNFWIARDMANPADCKSAASGNARFKVRSTSVADRIRGYPPVFSKRYPCRRRLTGRFQLRKSWRFLADPRSLLFCEKRQALSIMAIGRANAMLDISYPGRVAWIYGQGEYPRRTSGERRIS
jgi:hypothetical protein